MPTRGVLEAVVPHQPRLTVQTRGPLVVRDIDVFLRFDSVRVNLSIPTDSERVRHAFEPNAPRLERRWEAATELKAAGLPVGICVTPTLPIENMEGFADRLAAFGAEVVATQDFHDSGGGFGADTGGRAQRFRDEFRRGPVEYQGIVQGLRSRVVCFEGEAGLFPPPATGRATSGIRSGVRQ
jgi:hypothetical protein